MGRMKTLCRGATAALMLISASGANAALIETALSIVIDGSGSIGSSNFSVQRDAYASVLGSSLVPTDGSVVVNVIQFSTGTAIERVAIRINDTNDRDTVVAAINAMVYQNGGATAIGDGITAGTGDMDPFLAGIAGSEFHADFRKLVDVSTDGQNNTGSNPTTVTQNAVNVLGYEAVNCLGIGAGANCSFNDGGFGIDYVATTFADVEAALKDKIGDEFGTAPLPGSIALFGLALTGLGWARRYRAAA